MSALAAVAGTLAMAPAAVAVEACPGAQAPVTVQAPGGLLETIHFDGQGRLFMGELGQGNTFRLDTPVSAPQLVFDGAGSGLSAGPGGKLTYGSDHLPLPPETGIVGLEVGPAIAGVMTAAGLDGPVTLGLLDPLTGATEVVADGLSIANGIVYSPNEDAYYASNHEAGWIQRVAPDGNVDHEWLLLPSANGLAIDSTGRWLYATQTFAPARITRIDLENPDDVVTFAEPGPEAANAALDGLRFGPDGTLYAAAHGSGEIWRIDPDGAICVLATGIDPGLDGPTDVAVGSGQNGFPATSVYVTTFSGKLLELPAATP